ncbi:MAG TPA: phospho-N-acetylmuramoyl-pentapeptide-transferase [Chlamydiales bacterium]|nr:phospho-N-acetylmuramoyl-pentapeptide-transferase [Chlamydiales bacterium]
MLLLIIDYLQKYFSWQAPTVFCYSSTRMMLAAITTVIMTIFLGPRFIKKLYELKIGQSIRTKEECPLLAQLHGKKKDTPTMGGILILSSMLVSLFLWMDLTSSFTLILFLTTIVLGVLGGMDDYLKLKKKNTKGVSARKKLGVQILFSGAIAMYLLVPSFNFGQFFPKPIAKESHMVKQDGKKVVQTLSAKEYTERIYLPFFKDPVVSMSGVIAFLFIILVITGSSNAVNLTDGLDGLASGCLLMASSVLALVAFLSNHIDMARYLNILYIEGSGEIAIYLFALSGACLGFLWYNGYPAQVFMGDTGSLALGGILGVSAVLLKREILLALVGGIFVAEAMSVILQIMSFRLRNKKRVFLCAPLHHHFEYKGWPETKVVWRFWIIALLLAIVGVASLKFQ